MDSLSSEDVTGPPEVPPDSPGSSVSSQFQLQYDELLKYAVVRPTINSQTLPEMLNVTERGSPISTQPHQQSLGKVDREWAEHMEDVEAAITNMSYNSHGEHPPTGLYPEVDEGSEDEPGPPNHGPSTEPSSYGSGHSQGSNSSRQPPAVDSRYPPASGTSRQLPAVDSSRQPPSAGTSRQPPAAGTSRQPPAAGTSRQPPAAGTSRQPPAAGTSRQPPAAGTSRQPPVADSFGLSYLMDEDAFRVNTGTSEFTISLEHDSARMENLLDQWTKELKHNVMEEFSEVKLRVTEHHQKDLTEEREKQAAVSYKLQNDIENMKELLHTYETSMERKNQVISDLSQGVQAQQRKMEMLRMFSEWRMRHGEAQREEVIGAMAERFRARVMLQRCWKSWRSVVEGGWKQRVEKACQAKAQEVCTSLKDNYEDQISTLTRALEQTRAEVAELHAQRDMYEETMKKAFMRGVCALNMEAMSMFGQNSGQTNVTTVAPSDEHQLAFSTNQQPVFNTEPPGAPPPRVVVANPQSGHIQVTDTAFTAQSKGRGKPASRVKTGHSKNVGRGSHGALGGGGTLNPPVSSVVVERHQPVNKQTIGHATAAKYPAVRQSTLGSAVPGPQSSTAQRKIAGQAATTGTNVKMVE